MLFPSIFGGDRAERAFRSSPNKTLLLDEVQPDMGRRPMVRQVFTHFQNLNLLALMEDLRQGRVTRGNWSFDKYLCPVAHGMPNGQTVSVLRCLSQSVDLPRACRLAAEEMGMPARFVERFVLSWDTGGMSQEWLLDQLAAVWAERLMDAEAMQMVIGGQPAVASNIIPDK